MDMWTLHIAICDDDAYFLDTLQSAVRRYLSKQKYDAKIAVFSTGEELLNAKWEFDVMLIDIKLPGKNGIEIVGQLRSENKHCQVIFISSYQEYALQAFDLNAVHYCLKPVSEEKLAHALDRAIDCMAKSDCKTLVIAKGNQAKRIFIRDILFCEAIDHRIYIHTPNGCDCYFGTLDALQTRLDDWFFRCHKSYIVNLRTVVSKDRDTAILTGGKNVLISRRKQQEFSQRLLAVLREDVLLCQAFALWRCAKKSRSNNRKELL